MVTVHYYFFDQEGRENKTTGPLFEGSFVLGGSLIPSLAFFSLFYNIWETEEKKEEETCLCQYYIGVAKGEVGRGEAYEQGY